MKRVLFIFALILCASPALAQTQIQGFAADPVNCDPSRGLMYYNTVTQFFKICTAINTWSNLGGGGGGSPAGSNTQVQFNNLGAFGANSGFTFVAPNLTIPVNGAYNIGTVSMLSTPPSGGTPGNNISVGGPSNMSAITSSGFNNVAVGSFVMNTLTSGNANTAVGVGALFNGATTAISNTAIGHAALGVATGSANTALGDGALTSLTSGAPNLALGAGAAGNLTTGSNNTVIGPAAGLNLSTGSSNIIIGSNLGNVVSSGSNNLMIGVTALSGITATLSNQMDIFDVIIGTGMGTPATSVVGFAGEVDSGTTGSSSGLFGMKGSTSGTAKLGVAATAGTPATFLLPTTSPSAANQLFKTAAVSGGGYQTSWDTTLTDDGTTLSYTGTGGTVSIQSNGCFNVNSLSGGTSTVQAAITSAGTNGQTCVPATDTGVDIPNGTRLGNLLSPTVTSQPNGAKVLDSRFGESSASFYNPGFDSQNNIWTGSQSPCSWNENIGNGTASPGTGANNSVCNFVTSYWLSGTQNVNQNGYTNKSNLVSEFRFAGSWSPGQDETDTSELYNYSTGDTTVGFDLAASFGGQNAGSDEGLEWRDAALSTGYVEYAGALTGNVAVGATSMPVGIPSQGAGTQAADRWVYDITKAYNTGTVAVGGQTALVTVTGTSTAWTTAPLPTSASTSTTTSAAISVPTTTTTSAAITVTGSQSVQVASSAGLSVNASVSISDGTPNNFETVTVTAKADATHFTANFTKTHLTAATVLQTEPGLINIQVASSTGIVATNVLCVADTTTFEYVTVTAVPDGTHITGYFHLPHASGATIATGGLCGYGIEFTDDDWSTAGAIGYFTVTGTLRQVWPVVRNTSATSLVIQITVGGQGDVYGGTNNTGAYNLYPLAKTWQGTNNQSNTLTIEPLAVAMSNTDSVSMETGPAFKHQGLGNWAFNNYFPSQSLGGWASSLVYNGIVSGNDYGWGITNNTTLTKYSGHGGHLSVPPEFLLFKGLYTNGFVFNSATDGALLKSGCPVNSGGTITCTGASNVPIIQMAATDGNTHQIGWDAQNNLWLFTTNGSTDLYLGGASGRGLSLNNAGQLVSWNSDTGLSRDSAGVVDVGNGTASNVTGTIKPGKYATGTNCSSSAAPAVCGSSAAGSVVIAAAATTVTVNTTAVTANSQIFLSTDDTLGTKLGVTCNSTLATLVGGLAVTARTAGTSFQITSGATPAVNPLCISYFIVN